MARSTIFFLTDVLGFAVTIFLWIGVFGLAVTIVLWTVVLWTRVLGLLIGNFCGAWCIYLCKIELFKFIVLLANNAYPACILFRLAHV